MSIQSVQAELVTMIDGIKVAAGIDTVLDHMPTTRETTPAVAVIFDGGAEEYHNTRETALISQFIIRTIVEKIDDDDGQINLLLQIVDDILDETRKLSNASLNDKTYHLLSEDISPVQQAEIANTDVHYVDILIVTKQLKSIV